MEENIRLEFLTMLFKLGLAVFTQTKKKILFFAIVIPSNKIQKYIFFACVCLTARAYDIQIIHWFGEDPEITEFLNFPNLTHVCWQLIVSQFFFVVCLKTKKNLEFFWVMDRKTTFYFSRELCFWDSNLQLLRFLFSISTERRKHRIKKRLTWGNNTIWRCLLFNKVE